VHQAIHDPLTGLPNRVLFMDHLEHALARTERRQRSVAVHKLDRDDFKVVNDSLGHEMGDRLLIAVAGRLSACLRAEDTLARL
jgi:diguanylate cyclase (GGDEF)-like protein